MKIWPAIDIRNGKCVRLRQGDYSQETIYGNPVEMAAHWASLGTDRIHLVDLDGAKDGSIANFDTISEIVKRVPLLYELGGGIRSEEIIKRYLDIGIGQLVIGTLALKNPKWLAEMSQKYPNRLAVGIDAKNGFVATDGWTDESNTSSITLAKQFDSLPLAAIVYTDIATDGMMQGPNVSEMQRMKNAVPHHVIASGGVTTIADVYALKNAGLSACIIGRALYEGSISLPDALIGIRQKVSGKFSS